MSTVVGPAITVDAPFARLSVPGDVRDFWDSTNRRYKSGLVASVVSALGLAGTLGAGDSLSVVVKPPNYDPACGHTLLRYIVTAAGTVFTALSYTVNTANNYGQPGPSARLEGDGSISYIDCEITLTPASDASTTSLVPTLTYTNTTTLKDPYSSLGGAAISRNLACAPENEGLWAAITYPAGVYAGVGVQLVSLVANVQQASPSDPVPTFVATNNYRVGGTQICNVQMPLGASVGRTKPFYDAYSYIFAVNNQKIDANAMAMERLSPNNVEYNLVSATLQKSALAGGRADATLNAQVLTY